MGDTYGVVAHATVLIDGAAVKLHAVHEKLSLGLVFGSVLRSCEFMVAALGSVASS